MLPPSFRASRLGWCAGALIAAVLAGAEPAVDGLRLIGVRTIPAGQEFGGTVVGGLSGLDYDAVHDRWLAISDDRSEHGPARAYELKLDYDAREFKAVSVEGLVILRQADGTPYPAVAGPPGEVLDGEALRLDPQNGALWYTTEGNFPAGYPPAVRQAQRDGRWLGESPLPDGFRPSGSEFAGPRSNLTLEGLSFAADQRSVWLALEAPLYQDGPIPTTAHGANVRLTRLARDGKVLAQYAYPVDAIPVAPAAGKFADNGVSEVLATPENEMLVLERSGAQQADGRFQFHVRLYRAGFEGVTEVRARAGLRETALQPMPKQLLVDFDQIRPEGADNLEGMAWGRILSNGHRTLVLVSDNNFSAGQPTQLWLFEILPTVSPSASTYP